MDTKSHQFRDLTITPISSNTDLVVSCDISAGFGDRELDIVKCSPEISVSFTLRTAMLELIAYGAKPINVIDTLSVEYDPTGLKVIKRMKQDLLEMGYPDLPLNGSTEDNLDIQMTTVSVTVIGKANHRNEISEDNLSVFQLGEPYMGNEVLANLEIIFPVKQAIDLRDDVKVLDMIPVGSKGIEYELGVLAESDDKTLTLDEEVNQEEIKKTAGPSTILLVAVAESDESEFIQTHKDLKHIAWLRN